jgi:hypothetical protein
MNCVRTGNIQGPFPKQTRRLTIMSSRTGRTSICVALVAVMTMAMAVAATDRPASKVTGVQLVQDLARAARAAGASQASARLRSVSLGARPNAPITEAGAVALLKNLGVEATTSNPGRALSRQQADALVMKFRGSLAAPSASQSVAAGHQPAPASMGDCLAEKNHGLCVECCLALGGRGNTCAKTCHEINKPSASEPLP